MKNKKEVNWLHEKGIAVWLDVQSNDEESHHWEKMLKMGIEWLQADHPGRLIEYLKSWEKDGFKMYATQLSTF